MHTKYLEDHWIHSRDIIDVTDSFTSTESTDRRFFGELGSIEKCVLRIDLSVHEVEGQRFKRLELIKMESFQQSGRTPTIKTNALLANLYYMGFPEPSMTEEYTDLMYHGENGRVFSERQLSLSKLGEAIRWFLVPHRTYLLYLFARSLSHGTHFDSKKPGIEPFLKNEPIRKRLFGLLWSEDRPYRDILNTLLTIYPYISDADSGTGRNTYAALLERLTMMMGDVDKSL